MELIDLFYSFTSIGLLVSIFTACGSTVAIGISFVNHFTNPDIFICLGIFIIALTLTVLFYAGKILAQLCTCDFFNDEN